MPGKIARIFAVMLVLAITGCASGGSSAPDFTATDAGILIGGGFGAAAGAMIDQSKQGDTFDTVLECRSDKGEVIRPEGGVFAPREGWTCSHVRVK